MKVFACSWMLPAICLLVTSAVRLEADPFANWVQRFVGVSDIAFGNGTFVGVAGGSFYSSTNGADWDFHGVESGFGFYTVTYGEGMFLAVGTFTLHLDALTCIGLSTNGENWQIVWDDWHPNLRFGSLAHGNGVTVATSSSAGPLYYATNFQGVGPYWTQVSTGLLARVEFGGDRFVAVGRGGSVQTSMNGRDWLPGNTGVTNDLYDLAYGNGNYVAVGRDGRILRSVDGSTWIPCASPTTNRLMCIAFGAGVFVAAGFTASEVIVSTDAEVWQKHNTFIPLPPLSATRWFTFLTAGLGTFIGRTVDSYPNYTLGGGLYQSGNVQVKLGGRYRTELSKFEVSVQGGLERAYTLQATSNLTDWIDLFAFTNSGPMNIFLDPVSSSSPHRFYRAVGQ